MTSSWVRGDLQVTFAIERRREGHVVKGIAWGIGSTVWLHALNTVFCLVWGQLPLQLFRQDVRLEKKQTLESTICSRSFINKIIYFLCTKGTFLQA